ncbi:MAG: hypothetical protein WGN25_18740 [Candidatus Electrothrix sp. GW3-4]|uniref:hypothetical protein n=1 Tax=Candidatus Electrothrix sp. GW3-4 TaxID=3126740 RepID=UPI0030D5866B
MSNDDLSEKEYTVKLICLADECPIGRKNPECPLRAAREMPFGEKVQWVGSLSCQEKKEIYRYHVNCFSHKKGESSCEDEKDREEK